MAKSDWQQLLSTAPTRGFKGRLFRCLPQLTFDSCRPPRYLFTSGKANRCNPEGIDCLYMAEDRDTAQAEYDSYYPKPEPQLIYQANCETTAILDLADSATVAHFGLETNDLFEGFRLAKKVTPLQRLGATIAGQEVVSAMRFPSKARHSKGETGYNLAIFPAALIAPNFLEILGNGLNPLERWPSDPFR